MNRRALQPFFAEQLGLITTAQAETVGVTDRQLRHLREVAELGIVHRGVYRSLAFDVSHAQLELAAVLAAGPGSARSHRSAAVAIGLSRVSSSVVEISRPLRSILRLERAFVHRAPDLTDLDIELRDGIATTTPARTLVDLGAVAPSLVARAVDEWILGKVTTADEVTAAIERLGRPGRRGVTAVRHALQRTVTGAVESDSIPEARIRVICHRYGLPEPAAHVMVTIGDGVVYELDWAYLDAMVAIEVDGFGVHSASRRGFADDRIRHNELEILGWRVLHFAAGTVNTRPDIVARHIRGALDPTARAVRPIPQGDPARPAATPT
jgi:Protein of unknown function (DUF559)